MDVDVRVLRILNMPNEFDYPGDGNVTYLAEVDAQPPQVRLSPWPNNPLVPHPHRLPYAEPGGHQRDLDWATSVLAAQHIAVTAPPVQVRTWNLSSIWRLPTKGDPAHALRPAVEMATAAPLR